MLQRDGLTLETPGERITLAIPAVADPAELEWGGEDVVLLATKSQDTLGALDALSRAGAWDLPVFCLQNGVANERMALRRHADVYGAVVMAPTAHLRPGTVEAYGRLAAGMIDLGRYPSGSDEQCEQVAAALAGSRFHSRVWPDVMRLKYAKLVLNLGNAVGALCPDGEQRDALVERVMAEGRAALDAAGIDHHDDEVDDLEWPVGPDRGRRHRRPRAGRILDLAEPGAGHAVAPGSRGDGLPQRRDRARRAPARRAHAAQRRPVPAGRRAGTRRRPARVS